MYYTDMMQRPSISIIQFQHSQRKKKNKKTVMFDHDEYFSVFV
jgi:hypothetical protein